MANAQAATAGEAPAAPKKGKKLLVIILALVVLLVAAGGAAAFLLMKKADPKAKDEVKKVERKPPVFAPLEQFTVNLNDPGREHYLQIGLTFEVTGQDVADAIKAQMPLVRSRVLLLLTSKGAEELASPQGKAKLAGELVGLARATMQHSKVQGAQDEDRGIHDVHFSSFIIQ